MTVDIPPSLVSGGAKLQSYDADYRVATDYSVLPNSIVLDSVRKDYGNGTDTFTAISDISLGIAGGTITAVIGRSGCGKSTLLRIMAGLLQPSAGAIRIDNAIVQGPPQNVRYVFQDYGESLFSWATVRKNVEFGARYARPACQDIEAAARLNLARVGLNHAADRYPWELSGGMQQRVAIARALASTPKLLLMDEPFGAVDALSRASLQDMIQTIWSELSLTIVFVTHDLDEAIYLADRVVVLHPAGDGVLEDTLIDLPRPRDQLHTRENPSFLRYRRKLLEFVLGSGETQFDGRIKTA